MFFNISSDDAWAVCDVARSARYIGIKDKGIIIASMFASLSSSSSAREGQHTCTLPPLSTQRGVIWLVYAMTGLTCNFGETISTSGSGIDELDEGCILAEELNLSRINILATWYLPDRAQHLSHVLPSLGLVDALELDVDVGLCLHVWYITWQWQTAVLLVELTHRVGDDPEARPLLDLNRRTLASLAIDCMDISNETYWLSVDVVEHLS